MEGGERCPTLLAHATEPGTPVAICRIEPENPPRGPSLSRHFAFGDCRGRSGHKPLAQPPIHPHHPLQQLECLCLSAIGQLMQHTNSAILVVLWFCFLWFCDSVILRFADSMM